MVQRYEKCLDQTDDFVKVNKIYREQNVKKKICSQELILFNNQLASYIKLLMSSRVKLHIKL